MESRIGDSSQGGRPWLISLILVISTMLFGLSAAQTCGPNSPCASGMCCSKYGYCGTTDPYCGADCVYQCPGEPGAGAGSIVTPDLYNAIFPNRNQFYTYDSFLAAAASFPSFGSVGSATQQRQDVAGFLAHSAHETSGLVYIRQIQQDVECDPSSAYPCVPGQEYYGRGPLQISYNYNYGPFGTSIGQDLLSNPDLVATDPIVSWKSGMWFWTTAQSPKPACKTVMDGTWTPSGADIAAGRYPGFGVTTDIMNGGLECGPNAKYPKEDADRVALFQSISALLGVPTGSNIDCRTMQPY